MLYTPKDSKGALNHWTGTGFISIAKSVLVQKDREIDLFWLHMHLLSEHITNHKKQETSTYYRAHVH